MFAKNKTKFKRKSYLNCYFTKMREGFAEIHKVFVFGLTLGGLKQNELIKLQLKIYHDPYRQFYRKFLKDF
jgi:hypothetical protein